MRITVDTRAAERMLQRAPVAINRALEAAMNDAQTDIHAQMQTYPPKRRGSTYDRTNTLRGSWQKPRPALNALMRLAQALHAGRAFANHHIAGANPVAGDFSFV